MEIIVVLLILIALVGAVAAYQRRVLLGHHEGVVRAYRALDGLYRVRHDLIPTILTSLRANTDYDHGLREELASLRARVVEDRLSREPLKLEDEIGGVLDTTLRFSETHPRLQHDINMRHLRAALPEIDAQINQARADFNRAVERFNLLTVRFPTAPVARLLGLEPRRPLEIGVAAKPFEPAFEPMSVSFD